MLSEKHHCHYVRPSIYCRIAHEASLSTLYLSAAAAIAATVHHTGEHQLIPSSLTFKLGSGRFALQQRLQRGVLFSNAATALSMKHCSSFKPEAIQKSVIIQCSSWVLTSVAALLTRSSHMQNMKEHDLKRMTWSLDKRCFLLCYRGAGTAATATSASRALTTTAGGSTTALGRQTTATS